MPLHPVNFVAGWILVLGGLLWGAAIGMAFHREDFLGGYTSFPRRILRLGHISLVALGIFNVVFSLCPWPAPGTVAAYVASWGFVIGGITMPAVCFLTAWRSAWRSLFFIPVLSLVTATASILIGVIP